MQLDQSQSNRTVTQASGFDYGASGKGGWDEAPPVLVSARDRAKKERVPFDLDAYIARAGMQVRCAREVRKMRIPRRGYDHLGGIYLIENMITGHRYVGETYNLAVRLKTHARTLATRKHQLPAMNTLVRKHGIGSFRFVVLEQAWSCSRRWRAGREKAWALRLGATLGCGVAVAKALDCKVDDLLKRR